MTFPEFWRVWPKAGDKGDKQRASQRFERVVAAGNLTALLASFEAYRFMLARESWRTCMMLSTWLGSPTNERWREYSGMDRPAPPKSMFEIAEDREAAHAYNVERAELIRQDLLKDVAKGLRKEAPTAREILDYLESEDK